MPAQEERWVAVIGLGAFGQFLCEALVRAGVRVVALDRERNLIDAVSELVDKALIGDSTDPAVLQQAGVAECDRVIIAIGENTESSIVTTLNLIEMGVASIHARAISDVHRRILSKLGVSAIINPEREAAERLAAEVSPKGIEQLVELEDGFIFAEIDAPAHTIGKTLAELSFRRRLDITVVGVRRVEHTTAEQGAPIAFSSFVLAEGATTIFPEDRLLVVGRVASIEALVQETRLP